MESFSILGLPGPVARGLASLGFAAPTEIQAAALPALLAGRDLLMESETGTGKTFAYLAPVLALLVPAAEGPESRPATGSVTEAGDGPTGAAPQTHDDAPHRGAPHRGRAPLALIAAPTQELAVQIGKEAEKLARASGLEPGVAVLLGGSPMDRQEALLKHHPAIVVGTLGRLADLARLRILKTGGLRYLVLDEADRLLAAETEELALALLGAAPASCARVLASATLPSRALRMAAPFLRDPLRAAAETRPILAGAIEHWCFYCDSRKRLDFLRRFEAAVKPARCLVFLSNAARLSLAAESLAGMGLPLEGISARSAKEDRRVALERFANGSIRYLLTSDLGARGLDIPGISHIVSLDLPEEPTVYVHRAGRTGRAGARGVSVVLADAVELRRASRIALRHGFVFRTKVLEGGEVLEPPAEEFFARVEEAERKRDKR